MKKRLDRAGCLIRGAGRRRPCPVWAAGGSADDPVLSLSYLKSTCETPADAITADGTLFASSGSGTISQPRRSSAEQTRYKEGDAMTGKDRLARLLVLAGTVIRFTSAGGAVVNATARKRNCPPVWL